MSDQRSPARPWFDLVVEQTAIQGWSIHELSRRSGVGRPTIYRWRDGNEIPQSRPVGLVADALGIDRRKAVRLAGIVTAPAEPKPPGISDDLRRRIEAEAGDLAPEVIAAIEATLRGRGGEDESGRRAG